MRKITMTLFALAGFTLVMAQEEFTRQEAVVQKTEVAPVLDAIKDAAYTGDGYVIERWVKHGDPLTTTPMDGVSSKFWFAYDDNNLYVFAEVTIPEKVMGSDEIGITVDIDTAQRDYNFESTPLNENGFVFAKIVFGGSGGSSAQPDDIKLNRGFEYIFTETLEGHEIEAKIPWVNLTTEQGLIDLFKARGTFRFDIGYKLGGVETQYFAWSNDDNRSYRESFKMGNVTLSEKVVSVANAKASSFSIFPNPVMDMINIRASQEIASAEVFDLVGKKVFSANMAGKNELKLESLKSGVYVLKVNYASGKAEFQKFMKN
jgi:hypothetical protein